MATKKRDGEASRERMIQVATELFAQRGYAGTGVDEVASRSKIAKTALYYHFGNKEGLLAAVLERLATEWIDRIQAISYEAKDPIDRLDRALAGMRTMVEERPWILKLFQIMALEVADSKPEVRTILKSIGDRARNAIAEGFRDAMKVDLPDADGIARVLLALLMAIITVRQIEPSGIPLDLAFREIRQLVILMVAARLNPDLSGLFESRLTGGLPGPGLD